MSSVAGDPNDDQLGGGTSVRVVAISVFLKSGYFWLKSGSRL